MAATPPPRPWLILLALWALNFAASAQFLIITPLLPEIRDTLSVSEDWLGLLITTYALGLGVFSLVAGPISDRFGRRIIILVGSIGMTVALLLHGLATTFELLLLMRLFAGACSGLLSGATIAYVGDAFPFAQRGRANGILVSGFAAGQVLGIPAGAWLGEIGYRLPFLAFGIMAGIAAVLVALFVTQPPVKLSDRLTLGSALRDYAGLLTRVDTAAAAAAYLIMFLAVSLFITYLPTELNHLFDASPSQVGTLFMAGGLANLIVAPFAGSLSDRVGRKILVVGGSTMSGLLMAAAPFVLLDFWYAYPLFFIVMVFVALRISPMQALVSSLVPPRLRGSLLSLVMAIGQVGFGLGALVAGPLYTTWGFTTTAVIGGAVALVMVAVVLLLIPDPREDAVGDEVDDPVGATGPVTVPSEAPASK